MRTSAKPKVFISYVWLDQKDRDGNPVVLKNGKVVRIPDERAFNLAERLREFGFDSRLDVYFKDAHDKYGFVPPVRRPGDSRDPWIIWAEEQIGNADCVLLLCTPEYVAADANLGGRHGAWFNWHYLDDKLKVDTKVPYLWWDWHYITKELDAKPEKFIPIGFGPYDPEQIPVFVQGATYCNLESIKDFEGLLRRIKSEYRKHHPRKGIFVSYSHKDEKLFNEFISMMAPAIRKGVVDIWDDTKIKPGAK